MAEGSGERVIPLPCGAAQPARDDELPPEGRPALASGAQPPQPQGGDRVEADVSNHQPVAAVPESHASLS